VVNRSGKSAVAGRAGEQVDRAIAVVQPWRLREDLAGATNEIRADRAAGPLVDNPRLALYLWL